MQIILLEKVANLGDLGEVLTVKDGYARNFLIPKGKARRATKIAMAEFETRRAELEKAQAQKLAEAQKVAESMTDLELNIKSKAGVDGRLFGSVTNADIAIALAEKNITVNKSQIRVVDGLIKTTGQFPTNVHLFTDVDVQITVNVSPIE